MSSFTVRPYEPGDKEGILALFNQVFTEASPIFVPRVMETWRHLYLDNPFGRQIFVGLDADKRIIANYSGLPVPAVIRGQRRLCAQIVDSCVDKAWRGSLRKASLFVTIAREFIQHYSTEGQEPFDDFMFGLPNEKAFPIGTRVIGYQPVAIPQRALVHELGPYTAGWLEVLDRQAGGIVLETFTGGDVTEAAALFEANIADVPLGIWRDATYLSWRYRPRADVQYHALLARRAGKLAAVLVYRLGWMGEYIVPLVDWIGPGTDRAALAALLAYVTRMTRELGGRRVTTWVTPNMPHHATLSALGLISEPTNFNLCISVYGSLVPLDWARANWCFTMGDSDIF